MSIRALVAALVVAVPTLAIAQQPQPAAGDPATKALIDANQAMMSDMMAPAMLTGNPDKDFIAMMIPHHEGAIAMAKVVLEYGHDADVRALAEAIVKGQSGEVQWMKDWLAKQPK